MKGFTLVELAIVLIIIGLLIGGVLKGQELITNARIARLATQVKSTSTAFYTFQDTYRSLPGDMINPGMRLTGCAAAVTCVNAGGDSNGLIGSVVTNWSRNDQSDWDTEATQFWIHLSFADLISGVSGVNEKVWGALYPDSPMGGGFQVAFIRENGNNRAQGHYIILRFPPSGDPHPDTAGEAVLSPALAFRLDQKIDDGTPNTGIMIADDAGGACWTVGTNRYNNASYDSVCITAYALKK